jgi:hypothetical protein
MAGAQSNLGILGSNDRSMEKGARAQVDWNGNAITRRGSPSSTWTTSPTTTSPQVLQQVSAALGSTTNSNTLPGNDAGLSSSGGFVKTFLNASDATPPGQLFPRGQPRPGRSLQDLGISDALYGPPVHGRDLLLPPRRELNALISAYRKKHYPLFPVLDLPSFLQDVDAICLGNAPKMHEERVFCILNFICALSKQSDVISVSVDEADGAEPFYQRGRRLLPTDFTEGYSVTQLQALLLCVQFLLSTDKPQQCWILIGVSVRIAEALGLDRPLSLELPAEAALAKRLWHTCVAIDRLVAMCLGQRPTLNAYATRFIKLDTETNLALRHDSLENGISLGHQFFAASSRLFDFLYDILVKIYVPEDRPPTEPIIIAPSVATTVIEIEDKLTQWAEDLPEILKLNSEDIGETRSSRLRAAHFLRQRQVCSLYEAIALLTASSFLQVQIMLYRPGLAAMTMSSQSTRVNSRSFMKSAFLHSASACVSCGQEMISLCKRQMYGSPDSEMLTPWWMNILCKSVVSSRILVS